MRVLIGVALLASLVAAPAAGQQCEMPNMMIVLDRSGSMGPTCNPPNTKWADAVNAVNYILGNFAGSLRFGLTLFPSDGGCGAGIVNVDLGDNTASAITSALNANPPLEDCYGKTPIAATFMALNLYRPLKDIDRRNYIMLIADGMDTCANDSDNDPVNAAADLYNAGIKTYVIGFGSGVDAGVLNAIAAAAHTGSYYQADNQTQLQAAMDAIINEALVEICDDRDNDCDDLTDETWPLKGELCTATQGGCEEPGFWECNAAKDGVVCNAQVVPRPEVCDGKDNDCDCPGDTNGDGTYCGPGDTNVDEDFPDDDADSYNQCTDCCDTGSEAMQGCSSGTAPFINPGATEVCNGYDDNCNGAIDEDDPRMGDACGSSPNQGECQPGIMMCVNEQMTCVGEIGPVPEVNCDGKDNDCDGVTDLIEDEICDDGIDNDCDGLIDAWDPDCGAVCEPGDQQACGETEGECEAGVSTCRDGQWGPCEGELGPTDEVCDDRDNDCDGDTDEHATDEICDNGIDDDCDGLIDGMDPDCGECTPGEQRDCGTDEGECRMGRQICNAYGQWGECGGGVGPQEEECDLLDNDCDGITDEGHLCEGYEVCLCGECAGPCSAGECPAGDTTCVNGWCVSDPCCGVNCPPGEMCDENGICVDPCEVGQVQCEQDEDCRMGICVPADCFTEGHECPAGERCVDGVCEADPCADVDCPDGEYCREGVCEGVACADCTADQVCEDGQCVDSPCADVRCESGQVCVDGQCAADPCQGVYCPQGTTCIDGQCSGDPCLNIECPPDSECQDGYCVSTEEPQPDAGTDAGDEDAGGDPGADEVTDAGADAGVDAGADAGTDGGGPSDSGGGGGEGCGCGSSGSPPIPALFLLLVGLLLIRRRR